ncbi:SWPV1-178 [Shearwaterpox virus]|uniref:SWPV1-178 n=1 Tax=Shearwaterpox virus TaxID=1974596 RepID=A0A1V0S802_CNPV|nr:SWPV1-178 [Shearwaterpox virus]
MSNITLRHIDKQFCYVKLYDLCIIVMKNGDYVNASKLCRYENKRFKDWKSQDISKELIEYTETLLSDGQDTKYSAIIKINHDKKVSGTYICAYVLPHLAVWLSPDIAVKTAVMMKRYKELMTMYTNNIISYSDLCTVIRNFNSQYDENIIRLKTLYNERVTAINLELDEVKSRSKKLRNKYYRECTKGEMDIDTKEQYYSEISNLKDKLLCVREKLNGNVENINFELNRIKQRYFANLHNLNSYIVSGKELPYIIEKMSEIITINDEEDNDDVFV